MAKKMFWAIVSKENGVPLSDSGQFLILTQKRFCKAHWDTQPRSAKRGYKMHPVHPDNMHFLIGRK